MKTATVGSTTWTYIYDSQNRRMRKSSTGTSTDYVYCGWQAIEEYDGSSLARQFVYGGTYIDEIVQMDVDGNSDGDCVDGTGVDAPWYYQQDALFNVTAIADYYGYIKEGYTYDPYGNHFVVTRPGDTYVLWYSNDTLTEMGASSHGNPFTYTGRRFDDETDLHYYRNRTYSSERGRFVVL